MDEMFSTRKRTIEGPELCVRNECSGRCWLDCGLVHCSGWYVARGGYRMMSLHTCARDRESDADAYRERMSRCSGAAAVEKHERRRSRDSVCTVGRSMERGGADSPSIAAAGDWQGDSDGGGWLGEWPERAAAHNAGAVRGIVAGDSRPVIEPRHAPDNPRPALVPVTVSLVQVEFHRKRAALPTTRLYSRTGLCGKQRRTMGQTKPKCTSNMMDRRQG